MTKIQKQTNKNIGIRHLTSSLMSIYVLLLTIYSLVVFVCEYAEGYTLYIGNDFLCSLLWNESGDICLFPEAGACRHVLLNRRWSNWLNTWKVWRTSQLDSLAGSDHVLVTWFLARGTRQRSLDVDGGSQQIQNIESLLFYCWPNVCDAGPALRQHWVDVTCWMGYRCSWLRTS